jgi:hypothetical protein
MDVQMAMIFIDNGLTVSWTLYPAAGESRVVWGAWSRRDFRAIPHFILKYRAKM